MEYQKLLKSVTFPQPVNPKRVHAEIRDGMFSLHVKTAAAKFGRLMPIAA
jgi:hypothetical protein